MLNRDTQKPHGDENGEQSGERFQSDTQKVVQQHLQDENHVISEEDIRNVRIGVTPPTDDQRADNPDSRDERIADRKSDAEDDTIPGGQKATPWDVINPGT